MEDIRNAAQGQVYPSSAVKKQTSGELLTSPSVPSGDPNIWCFQGRLGFFSARRDSCDEVRQSNKVPKMEKSTNQNNKMGIFERSFVPWLARRSVGGCFSSVQALGEPRLTAFCEHVPRIHYSREASRGSRNTAPALHP